MKNAGRICLLISIVIHLVLVVVGGLSDSRFFAGGSERLKQEDRKPAFELVEIPEYVPRERPDSESNLVSDRDAQAADTNREADDRDRPHSEGGMELAQYERDASRDAQSETHDGVRDPYDADPDDGAMHVLDVDYAGLTEAARQRLEPGRPTAYRNLLSSAEKPGWISFNTYNWDFAPYMLAMKKRVESNIRPPYAFTHMGLVSGTNVIRFRVWPDGHATDLEILDSDTHVSLDRTSVRAIESSLPFLPLPPSFPDDCLEVTASFAYLLRE